MKCENQIAILMATYNGGQYVGEQIDSLLCQTFDDWHLYIHDDGSTDDTEDIIRTYASEHPLKITIMKYPSQGGACRNFLSMLEKVDAPYYMFCDQDDVWLRDKTEKTFDRMKTLEQQQADRPLLVHSDLMLTDAQLNVTDMSFIRNQHIKIAAIKTFEDYAATNTVTGCTTLFNQYAKACIRRPYDRAILHDAWLCLSVVAQGGVVSFIDEPLVKYRQHDNNTLGSTDMSQQTPLHKIRNIKQMIVDSIRHYREMNAVRPISIWSFIHAKNRYRSF
jgi:Glycosyltransferases involved in cell wall biogenesis